jgi:hypothetical protein
MVFIYERASIMVQMFLFIYLTMYLHIPAKAYFRSTGQRQVSLCITLRVLFCPYLTFKFSLDVSFV